MARPTKDTVALALRVPSSLMEQLQILNSRISSGTVNTLAVRLIHCIVDVINRPEMNPPLPFEVIKMREKLHGAGRSGTYASEPASALSSIVQEEPTIEERRAESARELEMLDRIVGMNEKLQNALLDAHQRIMELERGQK